MDAKVKTLTRALAWVAWGAALMLAPGAARTMGGKGNRRRSLRRGTAKGFPLRKSA